MDWADVNDILNTIPATFRRPGPNYAAWQNSVVAGLSRMTLGVDSIIAQQQFQNAVGKWLNGWGDIFGVPPKYQTDTVYRATITQTLTAWRGTPPGIQRYLQLAEGLGCTIVEAFPVVGYTILFNPGVTLTAQQIAQLPGVLAFVRPAGVPFNVKAEFAGLNLSTGNYLGRTHFPGSWLRSAQAGIALTIPFSTNNSVPLLPTDLATDPTINPSLAS